MRNIKPEQWAHLVQWVIDEAAIQGIVRPGAKTLTLDGISVQRWSEAKLGPSLGAVVAVADALGLPLTTLVAELDHILAGADDIEHVHRWPVLELGVMHASDIQHLPEETRALALRVAQQVIEQSQPKPKR